MTLKKSLQTIDTLAIAIEKQLTLENTKFDEGFGKKIASGMYGYDSYREASCILRKKEASDIVYGDVGAVSRSLASLGLSIKDAEEGAKWYCEKIEWESMWETNFFSCDNEYTSLSMFKERVYLYFLFLICDELGEGAAAEYFSEACYERGSDKCVLLSKRIAEALESPFLVSEDIAFLLNLDLEEAKSLFKKHLAVFHPIDDLKFETK